MYRPLYLSRDTAMVLPGAASSSAGAASSSIMSSLVELPEPFPELLPIPKPEPREVLSASPAMGGSGGARGTGP